MFNNTFITSYMQMNITSVNSPIIVGHLRSVWKISVFG